MKLSSITYAFACDPHGALDVRLSDLGDPDLEPTVQIDRYDAEGKMHSVELTAAELFAAANAATEHGLKGEVPVLPKTQRLEALRDRLMGLMANGPGPVTAADKAEGEVA